MQGFSQSKINEFIRSLHNIELQENLGKADEGYYKSIKTKSSFNGNYIEYENKGVKDKIFSFENILILSDHI